MSELFITGSPRDLSYFESLSLAKILTLGNVSHVKYIGKGSAIVESLSDPLCSTHHCFQGANVTFYNEEGLYTPYLSQNYKKYDFLNPCLSNEFSCDYHKNIITYASYNCLGWALGISRFLDLSVGERRKSHEQVIVKYIEETKEKFPSDHPSNVLNILENLDLNKISSTPILKNNTIAFYFATILNEDGDLIHHDILHGARYLTTTSNGETLNSWTSKWGHHPELFAHDYDYMVNTHDPKIQNKHPGMCHDSVYFVPVKDEEITGDLSEAEELL